MSRLACVDSSRSNKAVDFVSVTYNTSGSYHDDATLELLTAPPPLRSPRRAFNSLSLRTPASWAVATLPLLVNADTAVHVKSTGMAKSAPGLHA